MTYKNDFKRIETILSDAKLAAWGPKRIPIDGKRKVSICPKTHDLSCSHVRTPRSKCPLVGLRVLMMRATRLAAG
jgi:hypothetical protein